MNGRRETGCTGAFDTRLEIIASSRYGYSQPHLGFAVSIDEYRARLQTNVKIGSKSILQ